MDEAQTKKVEDRTLRAVLVGMLRETERKEG
jgi:hypothetical protein